MGSAFLTCFGYWLAFSGVLLAVCYFGKSTVVFSQILSFVVCSTLGHWMRFCFDTLITRPTIVKEALFLVKDLVSMQFSLTFSCLSLFRATRCALLALSSLFVRLRIMERLRGCFSYFGFWSVASLERKWSVAIPSTWSSLWICLTTSPTPFSLNVGVDNVDEHPRKWLSRCWCRGCVHTAHAFCALPPLRLPYSRSR